MPTIPTTSSPGKLIITYSHLTDQHKCSYNLVDGHMPGDQAAADAMAHSVAVLMAGIMAHNQTISSYAITNAVGDEEFSGPITPAVPVPDVTNDSGYKSASVCFGGRGMAGVPGNSRGQTRVFIYNGDFPAPGTKKVDFINNQRYSAFAAGLNAHADVWADFYGQKAVSRGYATVQFNAHAQRVLGS